MEQRDFSVLLFLFCSAGSGSQGSCLLRQLVHWAHVCSSTGQAAGVEGVGDGGLRGRSTPMPGLRITPHSCWGKEWWLWGYIWIGGYRTTARVRACACGDCAPPNMTGPGVTLCCSHSTGRAWLPAFWCSSKGQSGLHTVAAAGSARLSLQGQSFEFH